MRHGALTWVVVVVVVGCSTPRSEPAPVEPGSLEKRLEADPTWRPGEAEPVSREIVRTQNPWREGAATAPVLWGTVIRNRCAEAATFVVGPGDAPPGPDAPTNELPAGEAISIELAEQERVYVRATDGTYGINANAAGGWIILSGDGPCDSIATIDR